MATIKEIAEYSGASRGTVDRVIHNRGRVAPDVEKAVREAIEALDYKPNKAGRILASAKKSRKIGIVMQSNENRFFIIPTQQELDKFENACGNDWVINEKFLKQKQYYIRHPKTATHNLLIEAKSFYDYIEEEQKDELIDFILSHCSAKSIQIERIDVVQTKGKASANVKQINAQGDVNAGISKSDIFNYKNPKGMQSAPSHERYIWLNNSIMRSISALSEGGSLTQTYESDFTFGLSAGEAKTLGLDLSKHKKFTYSIHVEC